jgi:hypothetical protein
LDRRLGGLQNGLDDVEKRKLLTLPELELQYPGHPACSQSLSRLLLDTKMNKNLKVTKCEGL